MEQVKYKKQYDLNLGNKSAATLEDRSLTFNIPSHGNSKCPVAIQVSDIEKIDTLVNTIILFNGAIVFQTLYVFHIKNSENFYILQQMLKPGTYQNLINDLKSINPNIVLSKKIKDFLDTAIPKSVFKGFDFKTRSSLSEWFNREADLTETVGLHFLKILVILFLVIPSIIFVFVNHSFFGYGHLVAVYGADIPFYRVLLLVASRLFLSIGLFNVGMSLISLYSGHKVTIRFLILSLATLTLALL